MRWPYKKRRSREVLVFHRTDREAIAGSDWVSCSLRPFERLPVLGEHVEMDKQWYRVDLVVHSTRPTIRTQVFATQVPIEVAIADARARLANQGSDVHPRRWPKDWS